MFRPNNDHRQQHFFDSTHHMNPKIVEKLEKSWASKFYEHIFCQIDEAPFAVLYSDMGRPNTPVNILISLEYIKHMKDLTDPDLIDAFHFDYLVNYAVGIRTLGEMNLAPRTLYYFRQRVYEYCQENPEGETLLFRQFITLVEHFAKEAGIDLKEQRYDTTHVISNIKKAGRLSLAYDVLVKSINAIPEEKRTESLRRALDKDFKTQMLYKVKAGESENRTARLLTLCQEALQVMEANSTGTPAEVRQLLERFIQEQTHQVEGKQVLKSTKDIRSDSLQSAHDTEATYRIKGNKGHSGYSLGISETCSAENPFQLITDYSIQPNITSDVEILSQRAGKIREHTGVEKLYVDGGFHGKAVYNAAEENQIDIHLTNMTGKPLQKMDPTAFELSEDNHIITCPKGEKPLRANLTRDQTIAHFSHEACDNCQYLQDCYSKKQKKDHVVRINLKSINASKKRDIMKAEKKENISKRAAIEGTNSCLKRTGLDHPKVRGQQKISFVSGYKSVGQNAKRFFRFLAGGYKKKPVPLPGISLPIFT